VEKGEQEGTSMVQEYWLHGLAVTRDGKRILAVAREERIRVWDVETHEPVEEWAGNTGLIWCIALSPDDQLAANGGDDGKVVIREMKESGGIKHSIEAGGWVTSLCFSPTGRSSLAVLAIPGTDGVIHVYDVESGEPVLGPIKSQRFNLGSRSTVFSGHTTGVPALLSIRRCHDPMLGPRNG
jgi:WD40 repeat protein